MRVIVGDCVEVMRGMEPNSIDAIVTDPPYDLTAGKKGGSGIASLNEASPAGRSRATTGFMGKSWDGTGVAFDPATWEAAMRVLKPGGHLLAFGGPRTYHRLTCGIEDAGFEIRDCLSWLFGSGFPKSLDVSKAMDKAAGAEREIVGRRTDGPSSWLIDQKREDRANGGTGIGYADGSGKEYDLSAPATDLARQWEGWGTALKPGWEPCVVARKPLRGTVASNVAEYGTGAINVDACRIEGEPRTTHSDGNRVTSYAASGMFRKAPHGPEPGAIGRWPANVVLGCACEVEHDAGCAVAMLDAQSGHLQSGSAHVLRRGATNGVGIGYGSGSIGGDAVDATIGDSGGASRFFYTAKASRSEREAWGRMALPAAGPEEFIDRNPADRGAQNPRSGSGRLSERDRIAAWVNVVQEAARQADTAQFLVRVTEGFRRADGSAWSTMLFGSKPTGRSRKASKSTTSTTTNSTMPSEISEPSTPPPISGFIRDALSKLESGSSPADYAACVNRLIERIGISPLPDTPSMDAAVRAISARLSEPNKIGGWVTVRQNDHPT